MRCTTLCICLYIAGLVGAEAANNNGAIHPLVARVVQTRGSSDRKRGPESKPSSPSHEPPAQRHSPDRAGPSRWTTPPSSPEDAQPGHASANGSPKPGTNGSRPPSPQRNAPDASSPRSPPGLARGAADPSSSRHPEAQSPVAPARIRTNPARSQRSHSGNAPPQASARLPRTPETRQASNPLLHASFGTAEAARRAHRLQAASDESLAKTSATVQDGRGSVMTSRLGAQGPSQLTADHSVGTFSRIAISPYHAAVLATNNLNAGKMSARASGNLMVKGRIDSLDPNGRGLLRTAVPGKAEIKSELHGIGHIASEAVNQNPEAGHARIQADFAGYGFVEAAASQDAMRPEVARHPSQWAGRFDHARSPATQGNPSPAREEAMRQASGPHDPDTSEPNRQQNSGRRRRRSGRGQENP